MSSTQPPVSGQIDTPNPIELFWEKNRRAVLVVLGLVVVAFVGVYGLEYLERQKQNQLWGKVAQGTALDQGYSTNGDMHHLLGMQTQQQFQTFNMMGMYLSNTQAELVSRLGDDVETVGAEQLSQLQQDVAGTDAEPLVLWLRAARAVRDRAWDTALAHLSDLESRFPNHFLCASSEFPPQYRPAVETDEPEEEEPAQRSSEPPELEPAEAGSLVSRLRNQIAAQQGFESTNPQLFEAPQPDAEPTVVLSLNSDEKIKIRFYKDAAPEHVASFLQRCRDGFYDGLAIDMVERKGNNAFGGWVEAMHIGLPATKSDDRSSWQAERTKDSGVQLEFEDNELSHFPGMVAAAKDPNGKSSGERIWINANDCAGRHDGDRVIFGRVVEGMDAVERICREASFIDESAQNAGRGELLSTIRVDAVEIIGDTPPAPVEEGGVEEGGEDDDQGAPKSEETGGGEGAPSEGQPEQNKNGG